MQVACRYLGLAVASLMFVGSVGAADTKPAAPAKPAVTAKPEAKSPVAPAAKAETKPAAKAEAPPAKAEVKPVAAEKPVATAKPADAAKPAVAMKPVSFKTDIAPLLVKNCLACHGASDAKGDYQLHTFTAFSKPGSSGLAPTTAGKPDDSEVLRLLESDDADERMPKDGDPLPKDQVALVKRWIMEGAKYDAADAKADLITIIPQAASESAGKLPYVGPRHRLGLLARRQRTRGRRLSRDHHLEHGRRQARAGASKTSNNARSGWPTAPTASCWPPRAARRAFPAKRRSTIRRRAPSFVGSVR
ncbi:MAG: hypothetical protein QM775_08165 [Pirellulales bacterium]